MMRMNWKIAIGKYTLKMIESIVIQKSVESLADTAVITLPGTIYNNTLRISDKIKTGDSVSISFGYNDNLKPEFEGYVKKISTDAGKLKIECEDFIYLFRVSIPDIELKSVSVNQILTYVNRHISASAGRKISLACSYNFSYDKFVIRAANGYDVLKKIQDEAKPNIYLKSDTLHVHPQYSEIFGEATYDFAVNIDKEGCDLQYKNREDRKVRVSIEYTGRDGKLHKYQFGDLGGESVTKKTNTSDQNSIQALAKQEYDAKSYTGYEGSFQAWLVPYCDAGYKILLKDKDYEYKNGSYYVLAVETTFSQSGGVRKITLGKLLSNGN